MNNTNLRPKNNLELSIKYELLQIATNPFSKIFFYSLAFLNAIFLHGFIININSILIFILTLIMIEFVIEFFISPSLNEKQIKNLRNIYGILALPSLVPFTIFNDIIFLLIPTTFAVLVALLEFMKELFQNSRRVVFISIIVFLIIFFLSKSNFNYILISAMFLSLFTLAPLRLVENSSNLYIEFDERVKEIFKNNKIMKERVSRYMRTFPSKDSPFIINGRIYFLSNSTLFNEYKKEINDENIKKMVGNLSNTKIKIKEIFDKLE